MRNVTHALVLVALAAPAFAAAGPAPAAPATAYDRTLTEYETIRLALVKGSTAGVPAAAARLQAEIAALAARPTGDADAVPDAKLAEVRALLPELGQASAALAGAKDVIAARDAFARLTTPLARWRAAVGRGPVLFWCSMAKRHWLQPAGKPTGNPYLGPGMASCGELAK